MARDYITLYDTTLRDGAQTTGIDFSATDKRQIIELLDRLGLDYIEGGYPGANPIDTALFAAPPRTKARLAAFGMTKRAGVSISNDLGINGLLAAKAHTITYVAKSHDYHVHVALGCSLEENLEAIAESVHAAAARGFEVMVDLEHFFDGYKANPAYALLCAETALKAGASCIILCDTNGGTLPHEITEIITNVCARIPGQKLGIHAHDDTGQAVAVSLAAILAGVRHVQGTLNGLGERCGNANLITLIPTLKLKPAFNSRFEIGITDEALASLTHVSRSFDEILNRKPNKHTPYVGASAFATKAGIHAAAVIKDPKTYEHVLPESVGNQRLVLVSTQGGRSNVLAELERLGLKISKDDPRLPRLVDELKERESLGYAYEGADASFYLLAQRVFGAVPDYFTVERFNVHVGRRFNASGEMVTESEASVKVRIGDEIFHSIAEGNGPVDALDEALRTDLGRYQKHIAGLRLSDFKVRIFEGGTEAVTRVLIESTDETGESWTTVGVSSNIIDASFQALTDSMIYKLMRDGVKHA